MKQPQIYLFISALIFRGSQKMNYGKGGMVLWIKYVCALKIMILLKGIDYATR